MSQWAGSRWHASELPFYSLGLPAKLKIDVGRRIDRWLPRWADHVISVTDTIRDRLIEDAGMAADRVTTIANGVELEHFGATTDAGPGRNGHKTVIFTGNLAAYQGIELLLEAFSGV